MITIEETLAAGDIETALTVAPFLIYSEILEGARRPLVFLEVFKEDFSLVDAIGDILRYLRMKNYATAYEQSESTVISGMSAETWTSSDFEEAHVEVTKVFWAAREVSDYLKENYPQFDFIRLAFRDMGKSVMEALDSKCKDTLVAASGIETVNMGSDNITYADVVDAIAALKNVNWIPDPANPPTLIIAPDMGAALLKDTLFITTERYTTAELANLVNGEIGRYAGCRVMETSLLDGTGYAFVIYPSDTELGPVCVMAWKRRLKVQTFYQPKYPYTYLNTNCRAMPVVVQPKGIVRLYTTASP